MPERDKQSVDRKRHEAELLALFLSLRQQMTQPLGSLMSALSVGTSTDAGVVAYIRKVTASLTKAHTQAAQLGRLLAGAPASKKAVSKIVASVMEEERKFLDGFGQAISSGQYLMPDGTMNTTAMERRAASYSGKLQATANRAFLGALPRGTRVDWVLGLNENHCPDCPTLAANGPYAVDDLPTVPGACETQCFYNCSCFLETESGLTGPQLIADFRQAVTDAKEIALSYDTRKQRLKDRTSLGTIMLHGMPVLVENPQYTYRHGVSADGKPWKTMMQHSYGEVCGTEGADGDGIDCFLGPDYDSETVYLINQVDPATGDFDEHKAMLNFCSAEAAEHGYRINYDGDWKGLGSIHSMPLPQFHEWLQVGDHAIPYRDDWAQVQDGAGMEGIDGVAGAIDARKFHCAACDKDYAVDMAASDYRNCPECGGPGEQVQIVNGEASPVTDGYFTKQSLKDYAMDAITCPSCKVLNAPQRSVCRQCGQPIQGAQPLQQVPMGNVTTAVATTDAKWTIEARRAYHEKHPENFAGPSLTFPIESQSDVDHAARLIGHAGNPGEIKARIIRIAERLGLNIPKTWRAATDEIEPECPDCQTVFEWGDGKCNHCGSTKPPKLPPGVEPGTKGSNEQWHKENPETKAATDSFEGEYEILFAATDDWEVLTDARSDGLMRVRQLAMVVEPQINLNNRYIPRDVAMPALLDAQRRARAGAMLTEMRHPKIVKGAGRGGTDGFIDNHDQKTSRVEDVHMPDEQGRVYIDRAILDTEPGRIVAQSFRSGNPYGLSSRMLAAWTPSTVNGRNVQHFKRMRLSTWDDMAKGEMPAVPESRNDYQLLTDSMRRDLEATESHLSLSGAPESTNTQCAATAAVIDSQRAANLAAGTAPRAAQEKRMNEDIRAALDKYRLEFATGDKASVAAARSALVSEITRAKGKNEPVAGLTDAARELAAIDADVRLMGLFPDRPAPTGVPGNETNAPGTGTIGHAPDLIVNSAPTQPDQVQDLSTTVPPQTGTPAAVPNAALDEATMTRLGVSPAAIQMMNRMAEQQLVAAADADRQKAVTDAVNLHKSTILQGVPADIAQGIVDSALKARTADDVESILKAGLDVYSKTASANRLQSRGMTTLNGRTVDPASLQIQVTDRPPSYMESVEKLLAAGDALARRSPTGVDPSDPAVKARREWNRKNFVEPLIAQMDELRAKSGNAEEFRAQIDAFNTGGEQALLDAYDKLQGATDVSTVSSFYNQPVISTALLIQMYQDCTALQFVDGIGPGEQNSANWQAQRGGNTPGRTGWILEIPVETYVAPSGAGTLAIRPFDSYDAGLLNPENTAIPTGTVNVNWLPFASLPRTIAASITRELRAAAGLGALNYDEIGRHLYHIGADKNRRLDSALYNDMLLTSDEYGAITVTAESQDLTFNSSYAAGGSVVVNLNPAKAASTAPTGADPFMTYGPNVTAAIRLKAGGNIYTTGTYCGSSFGVTPVLPARVSYNLLGTGGAYQQVITHPVTVTAPANAVAGYIDANNNVQTLPQTYGQSVAPSAATYAVDSEIGVIAFTSGVSGSGALATTPITVTYSYATNFDNFVAMGGGNVLQFAAIQASQISANAGGVQQYLDGLVAQVGQTAAFMNSAPRYSQPNLALSSVNAAELVCQARIFAPLFAPTGTRLYPTPDMYAERNGIFMGRHNSPWQCGDRRMLVSRRGATKYGVGIPAQVTGPYPSYDGSGNIKAVDTFYLQEYSTIATPVVTDANGTVYNPPNRTIVLRSPNG